MHLAVAWGIAVAAPAWAEELAGQQALTLYPDYKAQVQLAEAATGGASTATITSDEDERAFKEFHPPLFSANKLHQFLGIGSITLATLALLAPKDDDGAHGVFGAGAAALGGAAVVTGLVVHGEDVGVSKGFSDPDNLHALFGTLGAAGFIAAAARGGESNDEGGGGSNRTHATLGIVGYTSMLIGIRITW